MFAIPKPEHPDEVAALRRMQAPMRALNAVWGDWFKACDMLGLCDNYCEEMAAHITDLYELIECGRLKRQELLEMAAGGRVVPMFDVDGNPVMREGEQMCTDLEHVERTERLVTETAQWMQRHNASGREASAYLRGRYGSYLLPDDEADFIARQADKIRRGEQP